MTSKIIVALDFKDKQQALRLVDELEPKSCAVKVGSEMFTHFGANFVYELINRQFKVFLDLKFHDIPNTVAKACQAAADMGVWMLNVHASGGLKMMQYAREALVSYGQDRPLLIAVTVLTSMDTTELARLDSTYILADRVTFLAKLAHEAGLDGVVSSAYEARAIKHCCGQDFITVTPGIRLPDQDNHDQSRVVTPRDAIHMQSDYLVIGRAITHATDPKQIIEQIKQSIEF